MPTLTNLDAAHLLRRTGFGGTAAEIGSFTGLERSVAVDRVMDLSTAPPVVRPAVDNRSTQWECFVAASEWWVSRMVTTPKPLQEKLSLFWHGHFASSQTKVNDMTAMFNQNQLFRSKCLGNFGELAQAAAIDSAMLVYLDNDTNKAGAEQENFARELMELFTMGVGAFTEADVIAMAKAWTGYNTVGWNGTFNDSTFRYFANKHDNSVKTLFGVAADWTGPQAIDAIVNGVKRPVCAAFIAKKMFSFFAHTTPSEALVQELANAFIASNMSIAALVRAVLMHDDFWAASTRYALVKSPTEFVVDVLRRTGIAVSVAGVAWNMGPMGQNLFNPPSVAGWGQNGYWLSTATVWARSNWLEGMRWKLKDVPKWASLLTMAPAAGVQQILDDLGIFEPSAPTRAQLEAWFTQAKDGYRENNVSTFDGWSIQPNALVMGALTPEFLAA